MSTFKDIALLVARIILGVILIAHGWEKFANLAVTQEGFIGMGVPLASASAVIAGAIEFIGGILLIIGLGTRIVGVIVFLEMLAAAVLVHLPYGVMVANNGWELVGALGAGALILGGVGAGTYAIDQIIATRKGQDASASTTSSKQAVSA